MDAIGKYIYGVIGGAEAQSFSLEGVVPLAADLAYDGAGNEQAYTVSWRDISAVVTDGPVMDCTAMPKDALGRLLVKHQQVIEKVMARHTILPLRLGTCAQNDEQVRRILASGYETIRDTLQKAQGEVEIDVTACLADLRAFLRQVAQAPEIAEPIQSLVQKPGGWSAEDQVQIGMLVQRHADRQKQQWSRQILAALHPVAQDVRAHDLMDDTMVLNSAFLVRKDRQTVFDQQVQELNARFNDQLNFRCVGPLPPYSFYTLEVKVTPLEEVDWARRQLGLYDESITVDAIKKAHRRAALACHPDKNPNVPHIEKKFAEMSRAYQILLDYYRTSGPIEHERMKVGPDGQVPEKTAVLVTVR